MKAWLQQFAKELTCAIKGCDPIRYQQYGYSVRHRICRRCRHPVILRAHS